jgi:hypothetical protein
MSVGDIETEQHQFMDYQRDDEEVREYLSEIIRLPGYWPADEDCKRLEPTGFCESGHVQFGSEDPCSTRTCSFHWRRWQTQAAKSMVARLAAYRYVQGDEWDSGRSMRHIVASPEQDQRWTVQRFWQERSNSHEPVEQVGGRGGAVIPHAYRVSDSGDELYYNWMEQRFHGRGKWSVLREYTETWGELEPMIEVAPHTHQLVAAEDIDGDEVGRVYEDTGWVVHNVRSLAWFFINEEEVPQKVRHGRDGAEEIVREGYEDMARLAMYLLSHGAVQPKTGDLSQRQTVTYWGEVHPGSFDPEEELTEEEWREIQERAAEAVGGVPEVDEEGEEVEHGRCGRDGCEAVVRPLSELHERVADPDHTWWDSLEYEQQCELLGAYEWLGDRPPPGAGGENVPPGGFDRAPPGPSTDRREDWIEWLKRVGRRVEEQRKYPFLSAGMTRWKFCYSQRT